MHRRARVVVVFVLAVEAILVGVEVRAQTLAFVPTGSTGEFEVHGNEIIIPLGGVQVELEVVLSGWGEAPGAERLGAFNATLVGTSLEGINASPPNPGVDLTTPNGVDCPGDDAALCPAPSPEPVTVTGGCGTFGGALDKDKCDDFQAGFMKLRQCFGDESTICGTNADCPSPANPCVPDPAFVLAGTNPVTAVSIPASNNIEWIGAASSGGAIDDGTPKSGGFLRLIVPTDARGTYTIQWNQDGEKSFFNGDGLLNMHITLVDGFVTVIGDCNDNGVVDDQDIASGTSKDCNGNTFPDECDIADGLSDDCNGNGVPDECELVTGPRPDCNGNDVVDECDIADGFSEDCNDNDVPDECDLADGTSSDCTENGVPDECEADCNDNRVADSCDIADGTSADCNGNRVPDECDALAQTGGRDGIQLVPTGSSGSFALGCNEIVIPAGGVQVEFEVLVGGWGKAPGNPLLNAYFATIDGESLLGVNADPPAPGIDLTTPDGVDCPGDNASLCPDPSPPPVTMSGTCGTFAQDKCDDFQAGFIVVNRCLMDESVICSTSEDCPSPTDRCVGDPAFALFGTDPITAVSIPANNNIEWIGAASSGGRIDDGRAFHAGMLRLIVPTDARGTYTIRWIHDIDQTLLCTEGICCRSTYTGCDGLRPAGQLSVDGRVTIASACCFEDDSCENLSDTDCALAGGISLPDLCGDESGGLSCRNLAPKNRYISFLPGAGSASVAYRVDLIESELFPESVGLIWWVDVPNEDGIARLTGEPVFRDWSGDRPVIDVGDCPIVPASVYEILATTDGSFFAEPLVVRTVPKPEGKEWGDIAGQRTVFFWDPPDGSVNVIDIVAALHTFRKDPRAPLVTWSDLAGARPNGFVNVTDIQLIILAFLDRPYPFSAPADCP